MLREEGAIKNGLEWVEAYLRVHGPKMDPVKRANLEGRKEALEWALRLRGK